MVDVSLEIRKSFLFLYILATFFFPTAGPMLRPNDFHYARVQNQCLIKPAIFFHSFFYNQTSVDSNSESFIQLILDVNIVGAFSSIKVLKLFDIHFGWKGIYRKHSKTQLLGDGFSFLRDECRTCWMNPEKKYWFDNWNLQKDFCSCSFTTWSRLNKHLWNNNRKINRKKRDQVLKNFLDQVEAFN